ncbi:MAG: hypothetical protein GXP31_01765 [Kiritimatiellaeota bacterium]|nr:hypothetical protein [Kiritimatiellota bacterium]
MRGRVSLAFLILLPCGLRGQGFEARVGPPAPLEVSLALEARAALRRGVDWLCGAQTTETFRTGPARTVALTILALDLAPSPAAPVVRDTLEQARRALLILQQRTGGDFAPSPDAPVEAAALALFAFEMSRKHTPATERAADSAARFLLRVQDHSGGFPVTPDGVPEAVPTAWAMWALRARLRRTGDGIAPGTASALRRAVDRAIACVERSVAEDDAPFARGDANTMARLFALVCLPERLNATRFAKALESVVEPRESTTVSAYTEWACLACLALQPRTWPGLRSLSAPRRDAVRELRQRTVRRLLALQQGNGSWGDAAATGARRTAIPTDRVMATARAVLALDNVLDAAGLR